jgi:hypothetical protein
MNNRGNERKKEEEEERLMPSDYDGRENGTYPRDLCRICAYIWYLLYF